MQLDLAVVGERGDGPAHPVRDPELVVVLPGHDLVADADPESVGAVDNVVVVDGAGGDELFADDLVDRRRGVIGIHGHGLGDPGQVAFRGVEGDVG